MGLLAIFTFLPAAIALKRWRAGRGQASAPEKQKRSLAKHDQSADDEPSEPQQQCGRQQFTSANTQADHWFSRRPWLLKMKTVAVQPFRRELWYAAFVHCISAVGVAGSCCFFCFLNRPGSACCGVQVLAGAAGGPAVVHAAVPFVRTGRPRPRVRAAGILGDCLPVSAGKTAE